LLRFQAHLWLTEHKQARADKTKRAELTLNLTTKALVVAVDALERRLFKLLFHFQRHQYHS
jgi:hypothetical protein